MLKEFTGNITAENFDNLRIAIIVSRFNKPITESLVSGAVKALENNGFGEDNIEIIHVPGAFEIPLVFKKLCRQNLDKKKFDGIITIGCVIKGETAHFEYICESVSQSLNTISYEYEMPLGFCVLTCYTAQQAYERSGSPPDADNNKGYESALAVLEMISLINKI